MHADMTAVTVQSNKIVLNQVRQLALLEPSYGNKQTNFWPTQYNWVALLWVAGWLSSAPVSELGSDVLHVCPSLGSEKGKSLLGACSSYVQSLKHKYQAKPHKHM